MFNTFIYGQLIVKLLVTNREKIKDFFFTERRTKSGVYRFDCWGGGQPLIIALWDV